MSLFTFPCSNCGESCQWPDRFCPGCGAAVRHVNAGGLPPRSPVVEVSWQARPPWRRRLALAVLVAMVVATIAAVRLIA